MALKTLVLCDDYWHPSPIVREGLSALQGHGFRFDWVEDARQWSTALMADYSLIVLAKSNNISSTNQDAWMTDEAQAAFAAHVGRGNGLLAIHSGTAGYLETPVFRNLLGGAFLRHPKQCQVSIEPLAGHPLAAGVEAFVAQDEHYFMSMFDPQVDVFLVARSTHGEQPAGWRRNQGQGRVAVLTPGHTLEVWLHPSFQTLLRNSLRWCGGANF